MATKNLKKMWHQFRRSMSEIENYAFSWHWQVNQLSEHNLMNGDSTFHT
jgi:hypothetical protein